MSGQSLVEFALASVVLVLLFGGLVDLTRAIHFADVLQGAAREGARSGAAYSAGSASNPGLDDRDIKLVVDAQLNAGGLPSSVLKNPAVNCPAVADGNGLYNPPYASAAFPSAANSPSLYICYDNNPALDYPTVPPTDRSPGTMRSRTPRRGDSPSASRRSCGATWPLMSTACTRTSTR